MRSKRHSYLLSLLLFLFATSAMGQGQVFIMGQIANSTSSAKLPEIVQVRTHEPLASFDLSQPHAAFVKTTLFNRDTRMSIASHTSGRNTRCISASISEGTLPNGVGLSLTVEAPQSYMNGYPGSINSNVSLSKTSKTIIKELGTHFSSNKEAESYIIEYSCELPATNNVYTSLKGKNLTVILTISEEL